MWKLPLNREDFAFFAPFAVQSVSCFVGADKAWSLGGKADMAQRMIQVNGRQFGGPKLFFVCGPCVIENAEHCLRMADSLADTASAYGLDLIFKASFDKANRTSISSYRGPGLDKGLEILATVKKRTGLPLLTDVHEAAQAAPAAQVVDVLQIPAFLSRQTDLILAAAATGRALNIKKGQFLSPWDMRHNVDKAHAAGNHNLMLTERGTTFGYNNLVVDFRSIPAMQEFGHPVVLDVTHSLQLPGGAGNASSGQAQYIPYLAKAAVAGGVDGLFFEVHDSPEKALSDGGNSLRLEHLRLLVEILLELKQVVSRQ